MNVIVIFVIKVESILYLLGECFLYLFVVNFLILNLDFLFVIRYKMFVFIIFFNICVMMQGSSFFLLKCLFIYKFIDIVGFKWQFEIWLIVYVMVIIVKLKVIVIFINLIFNLGQVVVKMVFLYFFNINYKVLINFVINFCIIVCVFFIKRCVYFC